MCRFNNDILVTNQLAPIFISSDLRCILFPRSIAQAIFKILFLLQTFVYV